MINRGNLHRCIPRSPPAVAAQQLQPLRFRFDRTSSSSASATAVKAGKQVASRSAGDPNEMASEKPTTLEGKAPDPTDFANYFCTYGYLYHQVSSSCCSYGGWRLPTPPGG